MLYFQYLSLQLLFPWDSIRILFSKNCPTEKLTFGLLTAHLALRLPALASFLFLFFRGTVFGFSVGQYSDFVIFPYYGKSRKDLLDFNPTLHSSAFVVVAAAYCHKNLYYI
jgi:hypothetical protein